MRESLYNSALSKLALTNAARATATTVNGTTVDKHVGSQAFRSVLFVIVTGTITDGTHTFAVQDSDDGSAWAAAAADCVQGSVVLAAADDDTVKELGYTGPKRYVRLTVTTAAPTTGGVFGAAAVLTGGRRTPVARS